LIKYYQILGLQEGASQQEITESFERLNETLDPANNDNLDFFKEEHASVVNAFNELKKTFKANPSEPSSILQENKPNNNLEDNDSIEDVFERYKPLNDEDKLDFINLVEQKISNGIQNYKIALKIICRFEKCNDVESLKKELLSKSKKKSEGTLENNIESEGAILVNKNDTPDILVAKYQNASEQSKIGVLAMFTTLAQLGDKNCALALHKIKGEPLSIDDSLLVMIVMGITTNPEACDQDEIPGAIGEFGLNKTNPVPVYGIASNEIYLKGLNTKFGEKITWTRKGSYLIDEIQKEIDEYLIYNENGKFLTTIYISPYHWKTSKKIPKGFISIYDKPKTSPDIVFEAKCDKSELDQKDDEASEQNETELDVEQNQEENDSTDESLKTQKQAQEEEEEKKERNLFPFIGLIVILFGVLIWFGKTVYKDNRTVIDNPKSLKENTTPQEQSNEQTNIEFYTTLLKLSNDADGTYALEGENFRLNFILTSYVTLINTPSFDGFEIIKGPIITHPFGKTNIAFDLKATDTGNLTIAPATVKIDGKLYSSTSTEIRVKPKKLTPNKRNITGTSTNKNKSISTNSKSKRTSTNSKESESHEYFSKGLRLFNNGFYELALIEFKQASALSPSNGKYFYYRASAYSKTGDIDLACSFFDIAEINGYSIISTDPATLFIRQNCNDVKPDNTEITKPKAIKPTSIYLTGIITDHKKRVLPGAIIRNKTNGNSVTTNFDGIYTIMASGGDEIVVEYHKYPNFQTTLDFSYGDMYVINVQLLKARQLKDRVIKKKLDYRTGKMAKEVTSN
tara:strand:- start:956 stop:3349 length:2394 start_codon:yes stop_codon:yes gene_type:complete